MERHLGGISKSIFFPANTSNDRYPPWGSSLKVPSLQAGYIFAEQRWKFPTSCRGAQPAVVTIQRGFGS